MTPITPLLIVDRLKLWLRVLAGVLAGVPFGMMITQTPAGPPVSITTAIVQVGQHLCRANDGVKTIYRHGRASDVYSFHCNDQAEFNEIPVTQRPIPSSAVLPEPKDWRNAH